VLLLLDLLDTDDDDLFLALSGGVEEPVVPITGQFWAGGFWADGFWSDGFWGESEQPPIVVPPEAIQTTYAYGAGGRVTRISVDNPFRYDPRDDDEVMQILSEIIASGVIYELGRLPAKVTTLH